MLNYIRTTPTATGLTVTAHLVDRVYETAAAITDAQMRALPMTVYEPLPRWNYTLATRAA